MDHEVPRISEQQLASWRESYSGTGDAPPWNAIAQLSRWHVVGDGYGELDTAQRVYLHDAAHRDRFPYPEYLRKKTPSEIAADEPNCFVATSAFENQDHPTVDRLREYRDTILADSALGRMVISAYYEHGLGERAAQVLDRVPSAKPWVRSALELYVSTVVEPRMKN